MTDMRALKALYENRKQFLLINYRLHGEKCGCSKSYIYAISNDLYPIFQQEFTHEGENQDPYFDCYKISSDEVSRVLKFIDDEWLQGRMYTFYDLENHLGGKSYRMELLVILRYCYLDSRFNSELWGKLAESGPTEASSVSRELAEWEI